MTTASNTCWSCRKVKGKRACPARGNELICSRCCGTKRGVEIACPDDCPYLHGAHDRKWESAAMQKEEARFLSPFLGLSEPHVAFLFFVHHLLFQAVGSLPPLSDRGLIDVVDSTLKTLETRSKGILYQHACSSPELGPVSEWLVRVLTARGEIASAPEASDEDVIRILETMRLAIATHEQQSRHGRTYLETAARVMGPSLSEAPALELPRELSLPTGDRIVSL